MVGASCWGWQSWQLHQARVLRSALEGELAALGCSAKFEGENGDSHAASHRQSVTVSCGSEVRAELRVVGWVTPLWGTPHLRIGQLRLTLRGSPIAHFERWKKFRQDDNGRGSLEILDAIVVLSEPLLGEVILEHVSTEMKGAELLASCRLLSWPGHHYRDVEVTLSRPKSALKLKMKSRSSPATDPQLAIVPLAKGLEEWQLNLPSQPFCPLLSRFGGNCGTAFSGMRVSGVAKATESPELGLPARLDAQLILDHWPVPDWPEGVTLVGTSGALGLRLLKPNESGSWESARVEVTTGIFELVGLGHRENSVPPRFFFEATGHRSCAELQALLPPSEARNLVAAYISEPLAPPIRKAERVTLTLEVGFLDAPGETPRLSWTSSGGCGLPPRKP